MEATALRCYLWSRSTWVESHTNQLLGEDDINTSRFPHCIEHRPSFDSNVSSISLNDTLTMWLRLSFLKACWFQLYWEIQTPCELGGDNARNERTVHQVANFALASFQDCDCMKILHTADFQFDIICHVLWWILREVWKTILADFL